MKPQLLKSVPLFSSLTDEQVRVLQPCIQQRSYPRSSFILRAGEETDALYIIVSGRVKILIPDAQGREVILAVMGPNEFFGEMGLLDDQSRSASVETLEACQMLRFPKSAFWVLNMATAWTVLTASSCGRRSSATSSMWLR